MKQKFHDYNRINFLYLSLSFFLSLSLSLSLSSIDVNGLSYIKASKLLVATDGNKAGCRLGMARVYKFIGGLKSWKRAASSRVAH